MHHTRRTLASDGGPVEAALAEYFDRLDRGEPVSLAELIAAHPGCESGLRQFFQHEQKLQALTRQQFAEHVQAGKVLGDFRLLDELGRGGMGVVYEAEQLSLGRRVALKVLPFAAMLDKQQLARFKNEARAAATLDHPHIVAVHSVGAEGDVHYYAMQLIAGQSLAQVIAALRQVRDSGTLSEQEAFAAHSTDDQELSTAFSHADKAPRATLIDRPPAPGDPGQQLPLPEFASRGFFRAVARLGGEAAAALDHAHQSGVLHRDIKPANLLLDEAGKLWIADFGLARMEADAGLTMTGDMLGTLRYMAPEQALAQRAIVDHRCDVYSLGATLYELLTLEPAFGETNRAQLLQQIERDEPTTPRQLNNRIPHDLETIVLKAMRKSADERYTTAQALADDLDNFLNDKAINAKPPTTRERLVKWSRRHPAVVLSTAAVLVAVTIAAAASAVVVAQAYRRETVQRSLAEKETQRAEKERESAERNFERARKAVQGLLVDAASGSGVWFHLTPDMRVEFSNHAVEFYESLLQEGSSDPSLLFETAVGYKSLAELQQDIKQTVKLYQKSLTTLERLCLDHPKVEIYARELANTNFLFGVKLLGVEQRTEEQLTAAEAALRAAISVYKQILKENPEQAYAFYRDLDMCFVSLDQWGRASGERSSELNGERLAIFQDAVRRAPTNWVVHDFVGLTLVRMREFDDAIVSLREATRLAPNEQAANYDLSLALEDKGLLDDAIAAMQNVVRVDPGLAMAQFRLGTLLAKTQSTDQSIAAFREAVRLEPKKSHYHYYLGQLLHNKGSWDEAIAVYRNAIRLDINSSDGPFHAGIAHALVEKGMLDEAIRELREAIKLEPDSTTLERSLGSTLARRGRYDEALDVLRASVRRSSDPDVRYILAQTLRAMGRAEEATHEYEIAIKGFRKAMSSDSAIDLTCAARMLISCPGSTLYDPKEAVTMASRAVKLLPNSDGFYWHVLGRAHYRASNYRGAVDALQRGRELGDDDAYAHFFLAMAEWQLGNTDAAREWYAKGIQWLEQRQQIVGGEIVLIRAEAEQLLGVSAAAIQQVDAADANVKEETP